VVERSGRATTTTAPQPTHHHQYLHNLLAPRYHHHYHHHHISLPPSSPSHPPSHLFFLLCCEVAALIPSNSRSTIPLLASHSCRSFLHPSEDFHLTASRRPALIPSTLLMSFHPEFYQNHPASMNQCPPHLRCPSASKPSKTLPEPSWAWTTWFGSGFPPRNNRLRQATPLKGPAHNNAIHISAR